MKQHNLDVPSNDVDEGARGFRCPLPIEADTEWTNTSLCQPSEWPAPLQAYATTIAAFPFPAAIFWDVQASILYNKAWKEIDSTQPQGREQSDRLPDEVLEAFATVRKEFRPGHIDGRYLLDKSDEQHEYLGIISPLTFEAEEEKKTETDAHGVMVQLFSDTKMRPTQEKSLKRGGSYGNTKMDDQEKNKDRPDACLDKLGEVIDNVPLDQHPFFHRFAEMLPSGLAILDRQAQAIFVNQHFYELTTHEGEDDSFKSWPQSIHPEDYDRVMRVYQDAFKTQERVRTEFRAVGDDQAWRLLLLTPLGDESLQHVSLREYGGFICSIVDISAEKSAELAQFKAAKEAEERKEQQERFIDMISHEIRNPLSAILHCTEDIEAAVRQGEAQGGRVDTNEIKDSLETINMCLTHQKNIVNDVLAFSKLDASMLSLQPQPCQPNRQLAASLKMFQPEFRKQHMEFSFSLDQSYHEQKVDWVMADLARIGQVVINLITNAIKFTARSQGNKKVSVLVGASKSRPESFPIDVVYFSIDDLAERLDATGNKAWGEGQDVYITVAVSDTGIGISKQGQRRLFERFRQATPKTQEIYGGSGLGLNISRKICQLHGGQIGVASEEGSGSTFSFFFKAKQTDADDKDSGAEIKVLASEHVQRAARDKLQHADSFSSSHEPDSQATSAEENGRHDAKATTNEEIPIHQESIDSDGINNVDDTRKERDTHILLVEDNMINQKIVRKKLESRGFRVSTANNGQEAIDAIKSAAQASHNDTDGNFDMILMDHEMPVMDGTTAAKEIRSLEKNGEIKRFPILGVSANVRDSRQDEMIQSGMDDVIGKPYKTEDMISKVRAMVLDNASR